MKHHIIGEITLSDLVELATIDSVKINGITLTQKDKQSIQWLKKEMHKILRTISGSTVVGFDFNEKYKQNNALLLYTCGKQVVRMVWKSDSPLGIAKAVGKREPLYIHIVDEVGLTIKNTDITYDMCLGNRLFLRSGKGSVLIPYDVANKVGHKQPTMKHLTQVYYEVLNANRRELV